MIRRARRWGAVVSRAAIEALENRRYLSGLQVNGIQQVNEALYAGNAPVTNDLHLIYDVTDDDGTLTNVSVVWNTGDDPEDWMPGVDFDPQTGIPHGAFPSTNTDQVYH
ncbi:MAG TPA: hypothetical protein VHD56_11920, partial [Tepidisphaeraceae bacterium]|nr:hypothetical protein [Tepidisphaeraceae bacterium]